MEGLDVLPVLLQQRDEEVGGQQDVGDQFIIILSGITDSYTHTQHLLQLEFDGRLRILNLSLQVITMRDGGGKLTSLVQEGTEQTGNLLDDGIRGKEDVILASCRREVDERLVIATSGTREQKKESKSLQERGGI